MLKPGWFGRQLKKTHDDMLIWPDWMLRESGLDYVIEEKKEIKMNELKTNGFGVIQKIPIERVRNLLVTCLEGGGSHTWLKEVECDYGQGRVKADFQGGGEFGVYDEMLKEMWATKYVVPFTQGSKLIVRAFEDERDYCLDLDNVRRGLQLMAEKYPKHFYDLVQENDDAETADVFLQLSLFGELVYC